MNNVNSRFNALKASVVILTRRRRDKGEIARAPFQCLKGFSSDSDYFSSFFHN